MVEMNSQGQVCPRRYPRQADRRPSQQGGPILPSSHSRHPGRQIKDQWIVSEKSIERSGGEGGH